MKKLKFTGRAYSGFDHGNNSFIEVREVGHIVEVSDPKAAQLLADFPKDWTEVKDLSTPAEIPGAKNKDIATPTAKPSKPSANFPKRKDRK